MEERIFDNPADYSRYLTYSGDRVSEGGTKPSIYITILKLKNTIKQMTEADMKEILGEKVITGKFAKDYHCKLLIEKLDELHEWQLIQALAILIDVGRIESVVFISICKLTDNPIDRNNN